MKLELTEIHKLELKPHDILVFKVHSHTSQDEIDRAREITGSCLKKAGLDNEIMFMPKDVEIQVIQKKDDDDCETCLYSHKNNHGHYFCTHPNQSKEVDFDYENCKYLRVP